MEKIEEKAMSERCVDGVDGVYEFNECKVPL